METIRTSVNYNLNNPELEKIAKHIVNIATLSMEKAVAHYADPEQYPITDDETSLEVIFLNILNGLPEKQRQDSVDKVLPRIKSESIARKQTLGNLASVDFSSTQSIVLQAQELLTQDQLRLSEESVTTISSLYQPLDGLPLPNVPFFSLPEELPKPERLQFRLHEVHCIDETNGLLGNEGGEDEIVLGGLSVNSKSEPKKIPNFKVGGYFDDGDRKRYSPPKVLAEFDLGASEWPKTQAVTLILVEEDNGDFPEALDEFFKEVKNKIEKAVGGTSIPYIDKIAGWVFDKLLGWIVETWEDNIFEQETLGATMSSPASRFSGTSTSSRNSFDRKQFGGHYRVTYDWNIAWGKWQLIGGAASEICASRDTVYATSPASGDIYQLDFATGVWTKVGGPGHSFVANNEELFGLAPDKSAVMRFTGQTGGWGKIGGPAKSIVAGGNILFAISPTNGDIYRYEGQAGSWSRIGGPGRMFVVSDEKLYGLTPDRSAIYEFDQENNQWTKIGGAAIRIIAGANELIATSPANRSLYRYKGTPEEWEWIGNEGVGFAINKQGIFGIAKNRRGLYKYSGEPGKWHEIGGAFAKLCGCSEDLFALAVDTNEVWMLGG